MKTKKTLEGKRILVGVSGGIACYKSCELVRLLDKAGADVQVVMTHGATQFVTPLTFQALSRKPVFTSLFDLTQESTMGHITLADQCDLVIIAPATADFIARVAGGLCDDLLTTILCVTRAPVYMAPAMNVHMYENPLVKRNITLLKEVGMRMIGPAKGSLACGYEGEGRMMEPSDIVEQLLKS